MEENNTKDMREFSLENDSGEEIKWEVDLNNINEIINDLQYEVGESGFYFEDNMNKNNIEVLFDVMLELYDKIKTEEDKTKFSKYKEELDCLLNNYGTEMGNENITYIFRDRIEKRYNTSLDYINFNYDSNTSSIIDGLDVITKKIVSSYNCKGINEISDDDMNKILDDVKKCDLKNNIIFYSDITNLPDNLDENLQTKLFLATLENKSENIEPILKLLFEKFPNICENSRYKKGETPLDKAIELYVRNDITILLTEKLNKNNLELMNEENKFRLLQALFAEKKLTLFNYVYKTYKGDQKKLIENLLKYDTVNIKFFNELILNNEELRDKNLINEITNVEKISQGKNQVQIPKRIIEYTNTKPKTIKKITDVAFSNFASENGKKIENKKLYEVTYNKDGTQQITYFNKNGKAFLKANIDKNNILTFTTIAKYNKKDIDEIINYNYKNIRSFDYKLSYLAYAPLKNTKNIIFKTNCNSISDIVNTIEESKKNKKTFICDFGLDEEKHNVQVIINNGKATILNTGKDFENIKEKIKEEYEKRNLENIDIEHCRIMTQNNKNGSCVEASKLSTVALFVEYNNCYSNFTELVEKLNKLNRFMEETLNKKTEEEKIKFLKSNYNIEHMNTLKKLWKINKKLKKDKKQFFESNEKLN